MKAKVEATRNLHVFSRTLLRGLEKSLVRAGWLMNRFATARLGVAIERHRLAKGSLPDNLDELVSTYIDAIPVHISTGNPVAWERKGNHRFRIPSTDNRSFTWKYDPILAAIQLGDLDRLEKMSDEGWELTTPKPGEETKHTQALNVGMNRYPDPNYLGVPESVALASQGALKLAGLSGNMELLQWLLDRGLTPGDDDLELAASSGRLEQVKMLEQAGANLDDIINASFQGGNLDLIEYLIEKADKPLSKNEAWRLAFEDLGHVLWTEESDEESEDGYVQRILNPKLTDRDFARIRNIATVMIENGLNSSVIKNAGDIANLTREGTAKLFQNSGFADEGSTEDSDDDGFYDYEEELTGHDPNDPDSKPTQDEVDAAEAAKN